MTKEVMVLIIVVVIIFAPMALIWAFNSLFAVGIEITFKTWLASLVLSFALSGGGSSGNR